MHQNILTLSPNTMRMAFDSAMAQSTMNALGVHSTLALKNCPKLLCILNFSRLRVHHQQCWTTWGLLQISVVLRASVEARWR